MDEQRKAWTKQDGEDASRLLAEMVKRAKDASGGVRPEKFSSRVVVSPANWEGPRERSSERVSALPRQLAVWEDGQGKGQAATDKALSSPIARRNPAPDGVEGPLSRGSK